MKKLMYLLSVGILSVCLLIGCQADNDKLENVDVAAQLNADNTNNENLNDNEEIHEEEFIEPFEGDLNEYMPKLLQLDVYSSFSIKTLSSVPSDDRLELTVRKVDEPHMELTEQEIVAIKEAIYEEIGEVFPLHVKSVAIDENNPTLKGKITHMEKNNDRVLIVDDAEVVAGNEDMPEAHWAGVSEQTILIDLQGNPLSYDDLKIGQSVEGWREMFVQLSYPGQTGAVKLIVDPTAEITPDASGTITHVERVTEGHWELLYITIDEADQYIVTDESWIWGDDEVQLEKEALVEGTEVNLWNNGIPSDDDIYRATQVMVVDQ